MLVFAPFQTGFFLISPATDKNAYVLLLRTDINPNESPGFNSIDDIWRLRKGHLLFLRQPGEVKDWEAVKNALDTFLSERTDLCLLWYDDNRYETFRPQVIEVSPDGIIQQTDLPIYGDLLLTIPGGANIKHDVAGKALLITHSGAALRLKTQEFPVNSNISIAIVDSHEIDNQGFAVDNLCGKLRFTLGGEETSFLEQSAIGLAYYYEQIRPSALPHLRRQVKRNNFNFINTNTINGPLISFILFPHILQKEETGLTDSCFQLKTDDQLLLTHFRDTFGDNISLNFAQSPVGLCFRLYASARSKDDRKSFGFIPDLHDKTPLSIKFKNDDPRRRFVTGDTGSQTIALTSDDTISFFHTEQAIVDHDLKILTHKKPDNLIVGKLFSAWLEVNACKPYYGDAETQQLYGTEALFTSLVAADGFKPFDQPSGFTSSGRRFPFIPIDQQLVDSLLFAPDLSKPDEKLDLESIVSRHRHNILQNNSAVGLLPNDFPLGNTTTPQGFIVNFRREKDSDGSDKNIVDIQFSSLTLKGQLTFTLKTAPIANPIWRSLQKKDAFLVLTKAVLDTNIVDFSSLVDVEGWGFDLLGKSNSLVSPDSEFSETDLPVLILKANGKSLLDSLCNVDLWTNDSGLYGLPKPTNDADYRVFKETKEAVRDSIITAGLHTDFPFLNDPQWRGVISLNIKLIPDQLPDEISGLLKGKPTKVLKARYLAFPLSRVMPKGEGFDQKATSFLGKISYTDEFKPDEGKALDFGLTNLNVIFENSAIKTFDASVNVLVNRLFDLPADPEGKHTFELKGSYTEKAGLKQYLFSLKEPNGFSLLFKDSILEQITFKQVSFGITRRDAQGNHFQFQLDGQIKFNKSIPDFQFPEFSIDFTGLRFPFSLPIIDLGIDFSGLNVSINTEGAESTIKNFFSSFPLKLKGFRFADVALCLPDWGFLPISAGAGLKFGFLFDLDLGNLGGLLGFSKINAEVLMGWNGQLPSIGLRLGTFNFNTSNLELGLQGIFALHIGQVSLCSFTRPETGRQTALVLQDIRLDILGLELPPDDQNLVGMVFANGDVTKVGWYVALTTPEGENADDKLVPFFAIVNRGGPDLAKIVSVKQGIDNAKEAFKPKNLPECGKEDKPGEILFDLDRGLFVAGQVHEEGLFDFRLLFNDPTLYGGNLEVIGLFDIDILYRKLSDNLGVWSILFRLPIPPFEMGAVSVTLGALGVDIYTNGDWRFKAGYTPDISELLNVGFTAQFAIFVGQMGFYLAKLSAATTDLLPPTIPGEYRAIQAGFVLKVGIGRDFTLGPLRAAASLSLYGYLEGLLAVPKNNQNPTLFALRGRVGFIAEIVGYVDFVVLKGKVHIFLTAGIGFLYVSDRTLILWIEGEVGVEVQLVFQIRIKIGFIKINIRIVITFTFRVRVRFEYPILQGNDALGLLNYTENQPCVGTIPVASSQKVLLPLSYYPELVLKHRPDGVADVYLVPNSVLYSLRIGVGEQTRPLTPDYIPFRNLVEKVVSVTWHTLFETEPWQGYSHFERLLTDEGSSSRLRFRSVEFDLEKEAIEFIALGDDRFQFLEAIARPEHARAVIFPPHHALHLNLSGLFVGDPLREGGLETEDVDATYAQKLDHYFDEFLLQFEQRKEDALSLAAETSSIPFNVYLWNESLKVLVQQAVSLLARKEYDCLASAADESSAIALQETDLSELEGTLSALMRGGLRLPERGDSSRTRGIGELTGQYNEAFKLTNGSLKDDDDDTVRFGVEVTSIANSKDDEVFDTVGEEREQWKFWRAVVRQANTLMLTAEVDKLIQPVPVVSATPDETRFLNTTPFDLTAVILPLNRDNAYVVGSRVFYLVPETLQRLAQTSIVSARLFLQQHTNANGEILRQAASTDQPRASRMHSSIQFRIRPVKGTDDVFELFGVTATDAFRFQLLYRSGLQPKQVQPFKVGEQGLLVGVDPAELADVRVFKNNLSVKTFPTVVIDTTAALAADALFNPVYYTDMTKPVEMLQIMTECAATNDGGYFVSLPPTLRPSNNEKAPKLLILFELAHALAKDDLLCYAFASHLEVNETLPGDSSDTYCLTSLKRDGQTIRQYVPRFTNDCLQFELHRQAVLFPEDDVEGRARAYLLNHYDQLVFSLSTDEPEAIISFDKNLPILGQSKDNNLLAYHHLTRLRKGTERWGSPYDEIGQPIHLEFAWRNAYGDQLSSPRKVTLAHSYFDQLLMPTEWPSFEIAYTFAKGQSIDVNIAFSPGKPMTDLIDRAYGHNPTLPNEAFALLFEQLQRHLYTLRLLADQLHDPHVINGALTTRLVGQDGTIKHTETLQVLDQIRQLLDQLPGADGDFLLREDWLSGETVDKEQLLTHLRKHSMLANHTLTVSINPVGDTLIGDVVCLEVDMLIERDAKLINLEVIQVSTDKNVLDVDRVGRVQSTIHPQTSSYRELQDNLNDKWNDIPYTLGAGLNKDGQTRLWLINNNWVNGVFQTTKNGLEPLANFAIRPIQTRLWSGVYATKTYSAVDLDQALSNVLAGMETALRPRNSSQLKATNRYDQLLNVKQSMAEALATANWVLPVVNSSGAPAPSEGLLNEFKQQLLKDLENFYRIDALADHQNTHNLIGNRLLVTSEESAEQQKVGQLLPGKISQDSYPVLIDFRDQLVQKHSFDYRLKVTHLEWNIETLPNSPYESSLWIQLIDELMIDPKQTPGVRDCPNLVRRYPDRPSELRHQVDKLAIELDEQVATWDYTLAFRQDLHNGDLLHVEIELEKVTSVDALAADEPWVARLARLDDLLQSSRPLALFTGTGHESDELYTLLDKLPNIEFLDSPQVSALVDSDVISLTGRFQDGELTDRQINKPVDVSFRKNTSPGVSADTWILTFGLDIFTQRQEAARGKLWLTRNQLPGLEVRPEFIYQTEPVGRPDFLIPFLEVSKEQTISAKTLAPFLDRRNLQIEIFRRFKHTLRGQGDVSRNVNVPYGLLLIEGKQKDAIEEQLNSILQTIKAESPFCQVFLRVTLFATAPNQEAAIPLPYLKLDCLLIN